MNDILRDYLRKFTAIYLNNIIIFFKDKKSHKRYIKKVLKKIKDIRLKLKIIKYQWFLREIKFVEYKVNEQEISLDENNVKKIKKYKTPTNVKGVKKFLKTIQ